MVAEISQNSDEIRKKTAATCMEQRQNQPELAKSSPLPAATIFIWQRHIKIPRRIPNSRKGSFCAVHGAKDTSYSQAAAHLHILIVTI